jgi:hypothetical protein
MRQIRTYRATLVNEIANGPTRYTKSRSSAVLERPAAGRVSSRNNSPGCVGCLFVSEVCILRNYFYRCEPPISSAHQDPELEQYRAEASEVVAVVALEVMLAPAFSSWAIQCR